MKSEDWVAQTLQINLSAVFRLTKACLRRMLKERHGRIINIGSVVGSIGNAGQVHYAAAKAGLTGFSKALAKEVATRNITVNTVAPGFIETDMTRALPEAQRGAYLAQIPVGRFGTAEEVASAVPVFWLRRRPVTSPGRRCTSTVACTWAKVARKAGPWRK